MRILTIIITVMILHTNSLYSQVSISDKGEQTAHESAVLELISDDKGLLIPRMNTSERDNNIPVDSDAKSLLIYNEQTKCFETYINDAWHEIWCLGEWICGVDFSYQEYNYQTIKIGDQCWFAENLRATKFNDGTTDIDKPATDISWTNAGTSSNPAYAVYPHADVDGCEDEDCVIDIYGILYNWHAVTHEIEGDEALCPEGWRVSNNDDWFELEEEVGISEGGYSWVGTDEGSKLAGNEDLWGETTTIATTGVFGESGFNGLPGGGRYSNGGYGYVGERAGWWTSTIGGLEGDAIYRHLHHDEGGILRHWIDQGRGYSVRCIKEE